MSDDKKSSNSTNENIKIFNGELFVNNNSNDLDSDPNNNFLRKSTSNSMEGGLSNNGNIRGSMKSNQSNGERFLTNSLMQDLRGSSKKDSDKKIELDKSKLKDQQNQLNITESSNNSNNNNEEDILANIKLPKNDINNQMKSGDEYDLYEDVENEDNEDNKFEMDVKEYNGIINDDKKEEMNDIININRLAKLNEFFNKNKKNHGKNNLIKGNELEENLSLRSSGGSACISSHSNNSNGNISMNINMRSSKIFNKKEKNSPIKQNDNNNSSGNLIDLNELNINNENDINQNNSIDNNNNIIINEINDNSENKKENQENKEDKEKKEKLAKIKDINNEKNFISKNIINFESKNINDVDEEDKIELEMQLFNLDSFLPESIKEKEKTLKENYENDKSIIQSFQNIMQNFDSSEFNELLPNINEIKVEKNEIKQIETKEENKEEDKKELSQEKEKESEKIVVKEMEKEEYVFEKFGKLGWECEKCNNFNFESRTVCNRCEAPKQPKSLEQIKLENELKSGDKKKKPLVERKGDWQCPLCHNLNFAFRTSCNRCKLPKEMYLNYSMKQQKITENLNNINNINFQNNYAPQMPTTQIINNTAPQLIQNQYNIIQYGYLPMYNPYFPQNHFNSIPQPNLNNINNINNYKRKYKFYKQ